MYGKSGARNEAKGTTEAIVAATHEEIGPHGVEPVFIIGDFNVTPNSLDKIHQLIN